MKSSEPQCVELINKSETYVLSFSNDDDRRYVTNLLRAHVYELGKHVLHISKFFAQ